LTLEQPTPFKVIVIPYPQIETIYDLKEELADAIFQASVKVARSIRDISGSEGMNLVQSDGRANKMYCMFTFLPFHDSPVIKSCSSGITRRQPPNNWPIRR
jgi:hypothetical protein